MRHFEGFAAEMAHIPMKSAFMIVGAFESIIAVIFGALIRESLQPRRFMKSTNLLAQMNYLKGMVNI